MTTRNAKGRWIVGAPARPGAYWIVWQTSNGTRSVLPVEVGPSLINAGDPTARPLLKLLGGMAYDLTANIDRIAHHMPLVSPEPPDHLATAKRRGR
jgi:hypothetical protein